MNLDQSRCESTYPAALNGGGNHFEMKRNELHKDFIANCRAKGLQKSFIHEIDEAGRIQFLCHCSA